MRQLRISNSITNRETISLEKYLQEINKVDLISPEEEIRLAGLIKKGDKAALDRLTKANLRFVVSVAKQYQYQGLSLSDLINEGNIGLITAAHRFDDTRGFKFISFAVWWIRQHILLALANNARMIRLPMNKLNLSSRIQKTRLQLEQRLERAPSEEEIAEELNVDVEEITQNIASYKHHISLDTPLMDDEEGSLLDTIENTNAEKTEGNMYHGDSLKMEIERSLNVLNNRQRETLCYYFGLGIDHPMSLEDIAQKFNLTVERVRQIKEKAIERLRALPSANLLRSFLAA